MMPNFVVLVKVGFRLFLLGLYVHVLFILKMVVWKNVGDKLLWVYS